MKLIYAIAASCLLMFLLPCSADKITLKDGTSFEGVVISEAGNQYVIEVAFTKTIKDERRIAKADVVKIDRDMPDVRAFEALAKLVPTPDLLTAEDYPQRISAVEKFLTAFPSGTKIEAAKQILETLKAESAKISAGGVKLNGAVIMPDQYEPNAYDLDARIMESKIRTLIDQGQVVAALRIFATFDRDYRTSLSYGALLPLIRQVIQGHVAENKELLLTIDARLKQRDSGLQGMSTENRNITEHAIKAETAEIDALYKREKDAKQLWVTPNPYHKASLDDTVRFGELELTRLATVKTVLGVEGGKAYRDAYSVIHNGRTLAAVSAAINNAKASGVPRRYVDQLENAARGIK